MSRKKHKKTGSATGKPKPHRRPLDIDFPKRLREAMANINVLTAAALARICNCERMTIGNWLNGKTTVDAILLFEVADKCGVSPRWLLKNEGDKFDGIERATMPINSTFVERRGGTERRALLLWMEDV